MPEKRSIFLQNFASFSKLMPFQIPNVICTLQYKMHCFCTPAVDFVLLFRAEKRWLKLIKHPEEEPDYSVTGCQRTTSTWGPMLTLYLCWVDSPATRKELEPTCCRRYSRTLLNRPTRLFTASAYINFGVDWSIKEDLKRQKTFTNQKIN